ncbi:DnaJ-domain-containing protein, partial [Myriangium duriaei CBS 260.36]
MILRSCRAPRRATLSHGLGPRLFSTTGPLYAESANHYETLGLQHNASASDIKKKFYALSKTYHPDLHPNDPTASARFVEISEAYAVLGSAEKRATYDRSITPASHHHHQHAPRGSHSSHSTPAGGRPASGLSRRRTQFRGPPPSFYRSGGWGEHSAKRSEHAARGRGEHDAQQKEGEGAESSAREEPGMGPGGFTTGSDNDVPHWDRAGHFRTQESVEKGKHRSRRWGGASPEEILEAQSGSGSFQGFLAVTGVLGIAMG